MRLEQVKHKFSVTSNVVGDRALECRSAQSETLMVQM